MAVLDLVYHPRFSTDFKHNHYKYEENCNFTVSMDYANKSKEARVVAYTCRYFSGPLVPNSVLIQSK